MKSQKKTFFLRTHKTEAKLKIHLLIQFHPIKFSSPLTSLFATRPSKGKGRGYRL